VVALWDVGTRARHFAFGVVALVALYIALWVSIGNLIHKRYQTPTPVRVCFFPLCLTANIIWLVLVLDWS
jgi:hypothetical protein